MTSQQPNPPTWGPDEGRRESPSAPNGPTASTLAWLATVPRIALISIALLAGAFVWTYWPTILRLARVWSVEPDYSHGFFVVPLALYFLWIRRDRMPRPLNPGWGGLALMLAALSMHVLGSRYYLEPLNGWSMIIWLAGATWLLGGRTFLKWCLPSLAFLVFMVPLPYRVENMFRQPLQRMATDVSCWSLQFLGLPALGEGNIIAIGDVRLEVAQACSGLRIFVSIIALASAYAIVARRPWQVKLLVFAGALPIAVVANAMRVTLVGVLYYHVSTAAADRLTHDLAGLFVIVLAAVLMACFTWYLGRLVVAVRPMTGRDLLRDWGGSQSEERVPATLKHDVL